MFEPRHPSLKVVINYNGDARAPKEKPPTPLREEIEQLIEWFKERHDDATRGGCPQGAPPNANDALELPNAGISGREATSILAWALTGFGAR